MLKSQFEALFRDRESHVRYWGPEESSSRSPMVRECFCNAMDLKLSFQLTVLECTSESSGLPLTWSSILLGYHMRVLTYRRHKEACR